MRTDAAMRFELAASAADACGLRQTAEPTRIRSIATPPAHGSSTTDAYMPHFVRRFVWLHSPSVSRFDRATALSFISAAFRTRRVDRRQRSAHAVLKSMHCSQLFDKCLSIACRVNQRSHTGCGCSNCCNNRIPAQRTNCTHPFALTPPRCRPWIALLPAPLPPLVVPLLSRRPPCRSLHPARPCPATRWPWNSCWRPWACSQDRISPRSSRSSWSLCTVSRQTEIK